MIRIAAALALLSATAPTTSLGTEATLSPEPGTTVRRSVTFGLEAESDEIVQFAGDESREIEEAVDFSIESDLTVVDRYDTVDDGVLTQLTRTYESISHTESQNDQSDDQTSPLEEEEVVFARESSDDDWIATFADGRDDDDELLENLGADFDLEYLLPAGEVEEGESWEVELAFAREMMDPPRELNLEGETPTSEEEKEAVDEASDEMWDVMEGSFEVTFNGEEDGIARFGIALEIEGEGESRNELDMENGPSEGFLSIGISTDFEGVLQWDVEAGHAVSFELTGPIEFTRRQGVLVEPPDMDEVEIGIRFAMSGDFSLSITTEVEESEEDE